MEATYQTTTDRARAIRKELKGHGITSRDVGVRTEYYSMGSSIRLTVKATEKGNSLSLKWLKKIAAEHESIARCEQTGDILSGGNRYVNVGRNTEGEEAVRAEYLEASQKAMEEVTGSQHVTVSKNCAISLQHPGMYQVWGPGRAGMMAHTAPCLALTVAEMERDLEAGFER